MPPTTADQPRAVTVYRGWDESGRHVWSPFVVKLEARLRFAGVPYSLGVGSPPAAPKGKIPYVEYCEGGDLAAAPAQMGDSTLIIKALTERGALPDLNAALPPDQKAHDLALKSLLEDKLYFYQGFERWGDNYYTMRDHVLWNIPWPVRVVVGYMVWRKTTTLLHGQGTGRFSRDEIAMFRTELWESLAGLLGEAKRKSAGREDDGAPFWALGGDAPTEADCVIFGFVVSVMMCDAAPDSRKLLKGLPVLLEYADRIHDRYFPDYEKWPV